MISSIWGEDIGYTIRFRHLSKCQPQLTLATSNYYDVIFLPNWRTHIWGKIDLGGHRFEWEAIPKDTDLPGKRTRILGYSNFIVHGFVGRHRIEERTLIWSRTWIWVLHIYIYNCFVFSGIIVLIDILYRTGKWYSVYS